jgi:hypothetical protein
MVRHADARRHGRKTHDRAATLALGSKSIALVAGNKAIL